jgi:hypothetical protein
MGARRLLGDQWGLSVGDYWLSLKTGVWPMVALGAIALIRAHLGAEAAVPAFKREPRRDRAAFRAAHGKTARWHLVAAMDTLSSRPSPMMRAVVDIKTSISTTRIDFRSIDMTLASRRAIPNVTMTMQRTIKNLLRSSPASRCAR